jgi:protein-disulfide isomerase
MQMGKQLALIACTVLVMLSPGPAPADDTRAELERMNVELENLKAGQEVIVKELTKIRLLLADLKRPAPARPAAGAAAARPTAGGAIDITLDLAGAPSKGSDKARITLVEYTDYQCPYCGRHLQNTMPQIQKNFVDTGKVRYVLRDFPLGFHALAAKAHESAHCAGEQGKYWEMHQALFNNQKALQPEKLPVYAESAGVPDMAAFDACLEAGRFAALGKQGLVEGAKAGVQGTPSFVLGVTNSDGTVHGTKFIRGAVSYAVFEAAIEELLAKVDS